jgi:Leu/Phe-tRNA-protein transferase
MLKMKKTIKNNAFGILLIAGFTLVVASCQKDRNENPVATK